jgi:hypothetical protein
MEPQEEHMENVFYASTRKIPKKRENFFHFSKFSLQSLVTFWWQKIVFSHRKVTKLCSENFEKWKKLSPFWGIFFCLGGHEIFFFHLMTEFAFGKLLSTFSFILLHIKSEVLFNTLMKNNKSFSPQKSNNFFFFLLFFFSQLFFNLQELTRIKLKENPLFFFQQPKYW